MTLELRFTIPGQMERSTPLDQPAMKIGALLSNQVVLRAPGVDPIHALIECLSNSDDLGTDDWVLTDLGSATGVKVNGTIIDVETPLQSGDLIAIGSVELTVAAVQVAVLPTPPLPPSKLVPDNPLTPGVPPPGPGVPGNAPAPHSYEGEAEPVIGAGLEDEALPLAAGEAANAFNASVAPQLPRHTVRVPTEVGIARRAGGQAAVDSSAVGLHSDKSERKKEVLFSPRKARPGGDVLEVVAYWEDTVLDVELFHPDFKKYDEVTIGDPNKAHLISGGKSHFERFQLAAVEDGGFQVNLRQGMRARLRRGGQVEKVSNEGSHKLGRRDIAHIKYGAVRYFMMFVRPPVLELPKMGPRDPLLMILSSIAMLLYLVLVPVAWMHQAGPLEDPEKDDIWSIVQVPEKKKPIPTPEQIKPKKPPIKIAQKKAPPPKKVTPPKPKAKPPKPAKPIAKEKPKQAKPVKKPRPVKKPTDVLTQNNQKKPPTPKAPKSKDSKAAGKLSKLKGVGMPSTGARRPDFKLAGPKVPNRALGKSGGVRGSGMGQRGGARKGKGKASYRGVEGVKNNKASGVNLSKLGLGVGKIMSKTGPGAVRTNFKSAAGGAGGGMGSASKTYGIGGVGSGKSLGLAGASGAVNNFGSGSGGFLSGQGGRGGAGGAGLKGAFGGAGGKGGRGRANVSVPPGDPVVSGGLTAQEISAVIRANLNQIRHCYEQLLQRSPNASGKISVKFEIAVNGRISSVGVTNSTVSDARMRSCVTGKIKRWDFPKPRGGQPVSVTYPFVFNPL